MLNNATIEGLIELKLEVMAMALKDQRSNPDYEGLPFEDRLGLLVDREIEERKNKKRQRLLSAAKLRDKSAIEDVDFRHRRGLDRSLILTLAEGVWIAEHHNVCVVGPTGIGKTYLACALGDAAIRNGHSVLYARAPRLFEDLDIARGDGRYKRQMAALARIDVLVIDDLFLLPLEVDHAAHLLEVIEDRHQLRSTILGSQLPIADWHEAIGDATIADAVLDRVLHRAYRLELDGDSLRTPQVDTKQEESKTPTETTARSRRKEG